MADYCQQCSRDLFGVDMKELAGLCEEGQMVQALCEGCGVTVVNHAGRCMKDDCLCEGHKKRPA